MGVGHTDHQHAAHVRLDRLRVPPWPRVAAEVLHLAGIPAGEPVAVALEAVGLGGAGDADELEPQPPSLCLQPVLDPVGHRGNPLRKSSTVFRPAAQSWPNTFFTFPSSASACKQRRSATAFASPSKATTSGISSSETPQTLLSAAQTGKRPATSGNA